MPRYLHIPHTPDTARTLTLSGRNCLVVSDIVTPPLKLNFQVMFKTRFISLLVLLAAVATGAVAQTTYKVSVKEGTEDANKWGSQGARHAVSII